MLDSGHERRRRGGIPVSPSLTEVTSGRQSMPLQAASTQARAGLLLARVGGALAGWVALSRDPSPLIAHWGVVSHLQTQLVRRNTGIGSALMEPSSGKLPVTRWAWSSSTWRCAAERASKTFTVGSVATTGRWPGKLRLAPDDTRDEILMMAGHSIGGAAAIAAMLATRVSARASTWTGPPAPRSRTRAWRGRFCSWASHRPALGQGPGQHREHLGA